MSDNPFAEPDDDRTVIRPVPGGRRRSPPPNRRRNVGPDACRRSIQPRRRRSVSRHLTVAASPLLQLLARLRAMRRAPDPTVLRERAVQDLRAFERKARDAGIAMEVLRPAHYALCASIDDVVLNTPWGAASGWASQTLVATFHPGARGADLFFDQLRQMRRTPSKFLPAIELMYLCLSLGYMGRYRQVRGEGELEQTRSDTHAVIAAQHQAADAELSPRWRGVAVPSQSAPQRLPVWVALAGAVALCGGLFLWASASLNAASDDLQAQVLATPPTRMPQVTRAAIVQPLPPPPAPPEPTVLDRLRASLQPDIDNRAVSLLGTAATPIVRIAGRSMFAPESAVVLSASRPLLERIAAALRNESGIAPGDRLHRQPAGPHACASRRTSSSPSRAPAPCGPSSRAISAIRHGSVRRGAPMPTRSPATPPPKVANRTGGSRSCCTARTDSQ